MSWILDHLNLVIVGALVLGSFLKSRFDSVKEDEPESDPFSDFDEREFPEESGRGTPPPMPYVPPPIEREKPSLRRKSTPPSVPNTTFSMPGAAQAAAEESAKALKHQLDLAARLRQIRETKAATIGGATSTRRRIASSKNVSPEIVTVPRSIRTSLRDTSEIRRAFVMREILDPPVGLR